MNRPKRVYVSVPRDINLSEGQRVLKHAILEKLRGNDIEPQEFQVSGLALRAPYTFAAVSDIMARCHGALILAFARWRDPEKDNRLAIPTVWNHFEGAFALALKKEMLVITEENVASDGITWTGGAQIILWAPEKARPEWLETVNVKEQFNAWVEAVKAKKDVF